MGAIGRQILFGISKSVCGGGGSGVTITTAPFGLLCEVVVKSMLLEVLNQRRATTF